MAYCSGCRAYVNDTDTSCPNCGMVRRNTRPAAATRNGGYRPSAPPQTKGQRFLAWLKKLLCIRDLTDDFDDADINNTKLLAAACYLGPFVILAGVFGRGSKYVMFNVCQAVYTYVSYFLLAVALSIMDDLSQSFIMFILVMLLLGVFFTLPVVLIMGIINALRGRAKTMPLVGRIKLLDFLYEKL